MAAPWTTIAPEQAARHPLYGVKNWLAVFAFGVLFGFLREIAELNAEALKAGMTLSALLAIDHPGITFAKIALGLEAIAVVVIYWAMFTKHPKFRAIASSILLLTWPLSAAVAVTTSFEGAGQALALSFFPWVIGCAVWVTYLQRSARVRVTFEHQIRASATPPALIQSPASHPQQSPVTTAASDSVRATSSRAADSWTANHVYTASITMPASAPRDSEEELYAAALTELDAGSRRLGLWAKCFAATNGVDSEARAMYLRERVQQLQAETAARRTEEAAQAAAESQRQRETLEQTKAAFVAGTKPTETDVRLLVAAAGAEPSLARLWERFHGDTLLHWCARYDLLPEARRLLDLGADPCAGNARAQRPHMLAPSTELRQLLFNAAASGT